MCFYLSCDKWHCATGEITTSLLGRYNLQIIILSRTLSYVTPVWAWECEKVECEWSLYPKITRWKCVIIYMKNKVSLCLQQGFTYLQPLILSRRLSVVPYNTDQRQAYCTPTSKVQQESKSCDVTATKRSLWSLHSGPYRTLLWTHKVPVRQ